MPVAAERQTLHDLVDAGQVSATLYRGSSARHAISALQILLHWLGFDQELKWAQYGADGDYGGATQAAVAEFARRNGSRAQGRSVTDVLAGVIVERYDSLEELKQLAGDAGSSRIASLYRRGGADRVRIASLQTLLHDLGYAAQLDWARYGADGDYGRSTAAAVTAFADAEGLATDGSSLTAELAGRIVERLGAHYGDAWRSPAHKSTPAAASLKIDSISGSNGRQYLRVSDGGRSKRFSKFRLGLYTVGNCSPASFVASHASELSALGITRSETNVMLAVAENEGNLDAINTWDNAFLSFGLFQWTAGQGSARGELPALLARIKREDRDLFERYCGQHGLDVSGVDDGLVYGYFSLRGTRIASPEAKQQLREPAWAFHFWRAGQDPAIQAMEIRHALARLERFYDTDSYTVADRYRVADLVTSEYGVGLILDNHVNRPAYLKACLAAALEQSGLGDPAAWGSEEESRLIDAYLRIRETYGRYPMTDAAKRARVTRKYLDNGTISDRRGSFRGSA
jgi:peptidoglycan hydrolase-like protein with peptidoglycan-binding domain